MINFFMIIIVIDLTISEFSDDFDDYIEDLDIIKFIILLVFGITISWFPLYCFIKIKPYLSYFLFYFLENMQFLLEKTFKRKTICYNKCDKLQVKRTFLNKEQIIKKINKKLKYIDFTNEDFEKYFLFLNKEITKELMKTNEKNSFRFKCTIKDFLEENNIELTNAERLIEKNAGKYELNKEKELKENNEKSKEILNNYMIKTNNNQNNQLDKLCDAINDVKS